MIRAPREKEAAAIADLFNAVTLAGYGTAEAAEADVLTWFTSPEVDVERDVRIAVSPDGEIAGYGDVADESGLHTRIWFDVRIRPGESSAVADALLDALEPRGREFAALAPPGEQVVFRGFGWEAETVLRDVYLRRGFEIVRHDHRMEIDLAGEPPAPEWPEGIEVRTFRPGADDRAVHAAVDEGFADMWEFHPTPHEEWAHHMFAPEAFDPELWFVATDGGDIAGVCLCRPNEAAPDVGWVRVLAVRPRWRRRGIAQALLAHTFREFRSRGFARAGLGVDAESTTGALELYTRAGMRAVRTANIYDLEVRPGR